jgi:hypothetical protein
VEVPFVCEDAACRRRVARLLPRLPAVEGRPIRIHMSPGLKDRRGPVHAGSFLRERRIAFDCEAREFPRIFVHEIFHFVWLRLGNARRRLYETLVAEELARGARGELGWSAEWRKGELAEVDRFGRTRRWREYCCESFCDTAAWLYAGMPPHAEFTLAVRHRERRRRWFRKIVESRGLSI